METKYPLSVFFNNTNMLYYYIIRLISRIKKYLLCIVDCGAFFEPYEQ